MYVNPSRTYKNGTLWLVLLGWGLGGGGPCWAQNSSGRIAYEMSIQGVTSRPLRMALEQQSQTFRNRSRRPVSMRQLTLRAQDDIPRLKTVLHSMGYYDGEVAVELQTAGKVVQVVFNVTLNTVYHIASWTVDRTSLSDQDLLPSPSVNPVEGKPAEAGLVLAAEKQYLTQLKNQGYPFCSVQGRQVTLAPDRALVHVVSSVVSGPHAVFGETGIEGLADVQESYVRHRIGWSDGQTYCQGSLHKLEKELLQCGLFASASVKPATALDPNQRLPIIIKLMERKHRTVRLGGSYVTDDQGLGAQVSWEHRNLLGKGRRLRADVMANQIEVTQKTSYLYPDIWHPNLDLLVDLALSKEYPEAYSSESVRMAGSLRYAIEPWHTHVWGGIAETVSQVEQQDIRSRYNFFEFPLGLDWDRRNDPLNATRGWQVFLQTTPQIDVRQNISFFKHYAEGRIYQTLHPESNTVLAFRAGVGAIVGAALENVPADRRFYSGGAGSVRGYSYQSIGPTADGKPSGGLSRIETSLELRSAWGSHWGSVLFLDGGTVFSEVFSHEDEEPMRWAAGLGLRYFTDIAPLRFDVAFPLNRESDDRDYQFYVSIGQSF